MRAYNARPVTVPATTGPATVPILTSAHRLCGWSLAAQDVSNSGAVGVVTAPAAGATIVSLASVPQGEYTVEWLCQLTGTPGAGEVNNFSLFVGAGRVLGSVNLGAVGDYQQESIVIRVPAGGATISIQAAGIGTAGAVYTASFVLSGQTPAQGFFSDGQQIAGTIGIIAGLSDTEYLGEDGIYIGTQLNLTVNNGTISGVVYVKDIIEST